ncbi:MAG: hypothetical protein V2J12_11630 [Gammaproteobacteria bacterium]|jgi:hypothetical protein|nr:hypothetical protein [Gammaproteobacteria bacterium]
MENLQVVVALLALVAAPVWAAEPELEDGAAGSAGAAEQPQSRGIERDIQDRIDAELMAEIQQKSGITVVYQTARLIKPRAVATEEDLRLAQAAAN